MGKTVKAVSNQSSEESETRSVVGKEKWWLFKPGQSGNPLGRPKGATSLKVAAAHMIKAMTKEEAIAFLQLIDPLDVWRMAEGNPHNSEDITHHVAPQPILQLGQVDSSSSVSRIAEHVAQDTSTLTDSAERGAPTMVDASPLVKPEGFITP